MMNREAGQATRVAPQRSERPKSVQRTRIRSVQKAASILLLLGAEPRPLRASEVAARLDMPVPTTYHLMETLADAGLVAKDAHKAYQLGPAVGVLSDTFQRQLAAPAVLMPPLHELAQSTGETVYLSGWQDDGPVVLATIEGRQQLRVSGLHTGTRGQAHARATGKLFLAHMPAEETERYLDTHPLTARTRATITDRAAFANELRRVRRQGFALDREEFAEGITCVSASIKHDGRALAAYTAAAPTSRFRSARTELIASVCEAADSVRW